MKAAGVAWTFAVLRTIGALAQSDVIVEENSPALAYSPDLKFWNKFGVAAGVQPDPKSYYHGGGYVSTASPGAFVSLTFNGSYVAFYSDGYPAHGMMQVELDDFTSEVSQYSVNVEGQKKFFEAHVDPDRPNHVLKLTCLEEKTMGVDYFVYTAAIPKTADIDSSPPSPSFSKTASDRDSTKETPTSAPSSSSPTVLGDSVPGRPPDRPVIPTVMGTTSTITTAGASISNITIISSSSSKTTVIVAVGAVFGGLSALCFIPLCIMLWCRRRRRARARAQRPNALTPPTREMQSLVAEGATATPPRVQAPVQRDGKLRNLGITQMSASGTRIVLDEPDVPHSRSTSLDVERGTVLSSGTLPISSETLISSTTLPISSTTFFALHPPPYESISAPRNQDTLPR